MLHFSTNNGIYIISFAHCQCFLYMHAHISDTDESKEKLALFDLHYLFIPAFTMFSFFACTYFRYRWFGCKANKLHIGKWQPSRFDWKEVTSDKLHRYFYSTFPWMYNLHTCTCSTWLKYMECKQKWLSRERKVIV